MTKGRHECYSSVLGLAHPCRLPGWLSRTWALQGRPCHLPISYPPAARQARKMTGGRHGNEALLCPCREAAGHSVSSFPVPLGDSLSMGRRKAAFSACPFPKVLEKLGSTRGGGGRLHSMSSHFPLRGNVQVWSVLPFMPLRGLEQLGKPAPQQCQRLVGYGDCRGLEGSRDPFHCPQQPSKEVLGPQALSNESANILPTISGCVLSPIPFPAPVTFVI